MGYLFDGYNVYHAACKLKEEWSHIIPLTLCQLIAEDMCRLHDRAVVVFDGNMPRGWQADGLDSARIRVVYSGSGLEADAILEKLIRKDSAPRRLMVVSSDRQVCRAARRRRARSISSAEYLQQLDARSQQPAPVQREPDQKWHGLSEDETAEWLDLFEIDQELDEPSDDLGRLGL